MNLIEINKIYNEDCFKTMPRIPRGGVDIVLTSPFYNTNKKAGKSRTLENSAMNDGRYEYIRYDTHIDNLTNINVLDFVS